MDRISQVTLNEPEIWLGITINERYRIENLLGQGGMGTVYRAHDSLLDRDVALKLLTSLNLGSEGRSRLLSEAKTVAKLSHPNIVTVFDAGEVDQQAYVVMEFIHGKTLDETPIHGFKSVVDITRQICTALQYAHDQDIVHRDLKPENVIIQPDGVLRLMDFGLAVSTTSRMTENGLIMGTVAYMSPEQAFGYEVTPASDLYSLGVMLYELTTRQLPFEAEDALAVITQHIHAPVIPPRAKNEEIPSQLNDLIISLLSKDPLNRPASAAEILSILDQPDFLNQESPIEQDFTVLDRIVRGRLIGRQAELEEAQLLWRRVSSGHGQALLISGEPGIGKTRLIREIITHSEVSGGKSLVGECYAETNAPYGAFAQITRQVLDLLSRDGQNLPDTMVDDLLRLTPDLRYRFPNISANPRLDPESEQQRLFENMVLACQQLSADSPLLLVVDDVHWADSGTVSMLHHVVRRTNNLPVMILATYREVELKESRPFNEMLLDLNRQRLGYRIKLERLDRETTGKLLKAIFDEEISSEFLDGIYRETNGNPFFIEEVCRALVENGGIYYESGEWQRLSMEELEIPQGVQVAVESRLAKMPEEHQDVLRMASIIGREFSYDILAAALEVDEDIIIDCLEAAEEAQMIQELDGRGDVTFVFVHALVPSAIADSVRTLRRRKLHKKVAEAIEDHHPQDFESLAYHFGEAGNDPQAIKYYTLAGERAAAAFANPDAEIYFQSALDMIEDETQRAGLLAHLGLAQARQGKYPPALENWRIAINIYVSSGEQDRMAELYARSIRATWDSGDTKASLTLAREGLSNIAGAGDGAGHARLLAEYARACYFNGLLDEGQQVGQRSLEMAEKLNLVDIQVETLTTLGTIALNHPEESVQLLEKAASLADATNLPRQANRAHNNLSVLYIQKYADYDQALQHVQKAADIAHQIGDREGELFYRSNIGMQMLLKGQITEVGDLLSELKVLRDSLPDEGSGSLGFDQLYNIWLVGKGDFDQALEFSESSMERVRKLGDLQRLETILITIQMIALLTGNLEQARTAADETIELAEMGITPWVQTYGRSSIFFSRQGEIMQAREHYQLGVDEIEDSSFNIFDRMWIEWAEAELMLAENDPEAAWSTFEKLHTYLSDKGYTWHANFLLTQWGLIFLCRDDAVEKSKAVELLITASEEFQSMAAQGFVDLIEQRIAAVNEG